MTLDRELGDAERAGDLAVLAPAATSFSTSSSRGETSGALARLFLLVVAVQRVDQAAGQVAGERRLTDHDAVEPGGARPPRSPCAGRRSLRRGRRRGSRSGRGRSPRRSCARRRSLGAGGRAGRLLPAARRGRREPRPGSSARRRARPLRAASRTSKSPSRQSRFVTPDRKIGSGSAIRTRVTEGSPSPRVAMAGAEPWTGRSHIRTRTRPLSVSAFVITKPSGLAGTFSRTRLSSFTVAAKDLQPSDEQDAVHLRGERHRVAEAEERRRVDDDDVGTLAELLDRRPDRMRGDELTRVGRDRPGGKYFEDAGRPPRPFVAEPSGPAPFRGWWSERATNERVLEVDVAERDLGQPGPAAEPEEARDEGRRRSRSTSATRLPARANATARFEAVVDLPPTRGRSSPGSPGRAGRGSRTRGSCAGRGTPRPGRRSALLPHRDPFLVRELPRGAREPGEQRDRRAGRTPPRRCERACRAPREGRRAQGRGQGRAGARSSRHGPAGAGSAQPRSPG